MKYLHVATKSYKTSLAYDQAIMRQTGSCLYSLIEGLRQEYFGLHTLDRVLENIRDYKTKCVLPVRGSLFTDSGGYSIIKGDVHPTDIPRFIECYGEYLADERDVYEYIFSLDIPLSLKHDELNNKALIYELNRQSLMDAKVSMEAYPAIREKYYFVWQFKILAQYEIWCRLFTELGLGQMTRNHALGGMVGLRGATGITYSPFIQMAFKCLHEWKAGGLGGEFRLHFLGIHSPCDRFQIALLEKLFRRYLVEGESVAMSYDSVHPVQAARVKKDLQFFSKEPGGLQVYSKAADVPRATLEAIYHTQELQEALDEALRDRAKGEPVQNTNIFTPLSIFSHKCLDAFFEEVIDNAGLVDMLINEDSRVSFTMWTSQLLKTWKGAHPEVFKDSMVEALSKNLDMTFEMHLWKQNGVCPAKLDQLVRRSILNLRFPFNLE
ncbi:hypothetical protein [Fundidesulfovibrio soli]|uniref:hypothetical protein n=1 Tax=Fundidesulfovibrio soli TaxID=2922716 RepID=UPI001FAFC49B|nr:hypothetical protein [Fundidesulfovibrio soli]